MAGAHFALLFLLAVIPGHRTYEYEEPYFPYDLLGPELPGDLEIQDFCDSVKTQFLKQSKVRAKKYQVVSYKENISAGMIYYVKVWLGGIQYAHLRIYKPLPYTGLKPSLDGFQLGKRRRDPIDYIKTL
ncbi:cystatin-A1-like isoform X1 [Engystomops pustulosus]|uniref:cystatin-A1-like isoform X1 n=1 Tax=Engystomops pustulosus TaxID=76066 RepID=UPI003AFB3356